MLGPFVLLETQTHTHIHIYVFSWMHMTGVVQNIVFLHFWLQMKPFITCVAQCDSWHTLHTKSLLIKHVICLWEGRSKQTLVIKNTFHWKAHFFFLPALLFGWLHLLNKSWILSRFSGKRTVTHLNRTQTKSTPSLRQDHRQPDHTGSCTHCSNNHTVISLGYWNCFRSCSADN